MTLREKVEALATEWEALGNAPVRFAYHEQHAADSAEADTYERCSAALRALLASPEATTPVLGFADALRIARGCTDYGGGYRGDDEEFAIYQHGIQTVINSLTAAAERGLADTQVLALHAMGAPALAPSIATRLGPHCTEGDEETLAHTTNACKEIER
jgi:hypothetical protein